jgi:two-component system NtrC family sensor kinase
MPFIATLINKPAYLIWPVEWPGIFMLAVFTVVVIVGNWKWQGYQRSLREREWFLFGILLTLTPVFALNIGVRVPQWGALPLPNMSLDPTGGALMFLAALPAVLAGWALGPLSASVLGLVSGICLAYWDTHSPFTIMEYTIVAMLLSVAIRQRYRTVIFSILRRPFLATLLIALIHYIMYVLGAFVWASGSIVENLDFAISNSKTAVAAVGGCFAAAGLITEFAVVAFPDVDGIRKKTIPSPAESSLKVRFLGYVVWLTLALIVVLLVVNWFIAGDSAEKMVRTQMENIARTTTNEIPFFFNTGQSLISQYAQDFSGLEMTPDDQLRALERDFRSIPFFSQLVIYDLEKTQIGSYPEIAEQDFQLPYAVQTGLTSALNGVPVQVYVSPPTGLDAGTMISFIGRIQNQDGQPQGALLGVAEMLSNPFTQPVISDLEGIEDLGGVGYLLDENGRVLYSTQGEVYGGYLPGFDYSLQDSFFKRTTSDGTRQLVYIRSAPGRPWTVMLTIPAVQAQQLALDLAAPLSAVVLLIVVIAMAAMYVGLSSAADSLRVLTEEADRITKGELDHPLQMTARVDEVGRMRRSFEKMRRSLMNRMQELNRLLTVSRGVASSLEFHDAVDSILKSALEFGGVSARIVLDAKVLPDSDLDTSSRSRIGWGSETETYSYLDQQILEITSSRSPIVVSNPARMPLLDAADGNPIPGAILAVALQQDQQYFGVIWVAYDQPHNFPDSEVRFMSTLAGQAALAASNSLLFQNAELGRQRLAAILASTPDPIIVTDHQNRLLLCNPVAGDLIDLDQAVQPGSDLEQITTHQDLMDLIRDDSDLEKTREIHLESGKVYLASVSPVIGKEQQLGKVCVLRDITQHKEVEELKSDFVSTVSHDLRSPLTLMRGYATMLEMVGELNDQQQNYVHKIIMGVESMSHLVQNLLDLGRIEAEIGLKLDMISAPDIVADVVDAYQIRANQKKITLHVDPPAQTIPFVSADKALLTQALRNLVDNAINFNTQHGEVWLRYHLEEGQIVFEVQDTGIGISPVDQQRLFEKFYRVESREKDKQQGTGLGLAIVRSIAERHGGRTWVESELGQGSKFYLSIPIRQPEKPKDKTSGVRKLL